MSDDDRYEKVFGGWLLKPGKPPPPKFPWGMVIALAVVAVASAAVALLGSPFG